MAARYANASEVIAIAPEFTGQEAIIDVWLTVAECWIDPSVWGSCASTAHALLAAHMVTTSPVGGTIGGEGDGAGPLSGESNGPASRSYATPQPSDAELGLSSYGRLFVSLRERVRPRTAAVLMRGGQRFRRGVKIS